MTWKEPIEADGYLSCRKPCSHWLESTLNAHLSPGEFPSTWVPGSSLGSLRCASGEDVNSQDVGEATSDIFIFICVTCCVFLLSFPGTEE